MAKNKCKVVRTILQRKQVFEPDQLESSELRRCLNRWDLTSLGLGSTLGVGIYVLMGSVALKVAGPSIVLSFVIAAVASLLAGLCYAEFGARVPRAGSAYTYTYVAVGECAAFAVGWNMLLEMLFGTASVARGLSMFIDSMAGGVMTDWFTSVAPVSVHFLSAYFDFFSFLIVLVFGVLLAVGTRESTMVNNAFTILNMIVILFIIAVGAFAADQNNWSIPETEVPEHFGGGGFFPYGVWGTLQGAALCFYGFVGFDAISSTGEEVKQPRQAIPQSILLTLGVALVLYMIVGTIVTMMVPYYLLDQVAAVATVFAQVDWNWAKWIVSIGAVFGILASLFGSLFPLPRLLYSMASDGLFHHWFAQINSSRKSPIIATVAPAIVIAILAGLMELNQLIMMVCIGTLLSYTIVASCVILLRYRPLTKSDVTPSYLTQALGCGGRIPSKVSSRVVTIALILFICVCITTAIVGTNVEEPAISVVVLHVIGLLLLAIMIFQPQCQADLPFKTPLVPVVPCLSIYVNIHLMILVNIQTWIRVLVWAAMGVPIYIICVCCYKRNKNNFEENLKNFSHVEQNGKPPVQIIVEAPTPPTIRKNSERGDESDDIVQNDLAAIKRSSVISKENEIIVQQAYIENNEEKEAKIIDLLDQVLQAEEDSYTEQISLKEEKSEENIMVPIEDTTESIPHRKSLSELSDAGSDASTGNQELSKYSVIAQVHREDLPKVSEEEEKADKESDHADNETDEEVTAFNDSETNSRTDESGYSDTLDKNGLIDSVEETREEAPYIPTPPPFDENFFNSPFLMKKSYSIPPRPMKQISLEEEVSKPRESVQSNASQDDGTMVFGSSRQMKFMNKLNDIFQTKIVNETEGEEQRKRSNSTGAVVDTSELTHHQNMMRERPSLFISRDMKKELLAMHTMPNLRPVNIDKEDKKDTNSNDEEETAEDASMSRQDLKSKLETIFAAGGPMLIKPRLMKSNPPTPEENYQTDTSSNESIAKMPKMEKNDTLKRQRDKFGDVLNSFRLSLNKEDAV
ncbi:cationic amino acid transporter 2-like [Pectinophora gossypiella]|uniref:cationic amino acid transporter 2-like n=1 Tax=Pectinophora gossypiella TaxID=13191 RepID=UPI00214F1A5F|nr:cationic amino acid transporter 2-like [Pectinophora gossypiella]XP_049872955.1 cationic amino acid transporter 2-like [Pectinophora gossypiella]XP_049872956.1 cationic amino acid transporter 2-like [Pectinophora gossypiella]